MRHLTFLAFALVLLAGCNRERGGIDIPIPQAAIQSQVATQFPVKRGSVEFRDPEVLLSGAGAGGDRIGFRMAFTAPLVVMKASGTVEANGKLRYEPASGSLYFDDPRIADLRVSHVPHAVSEGAARVVNPALKSLLPSLQVYQFDDSLQSTLTKKTLRAVRVEGGQVILTFGFNP
jgi:hypothetical protein